MTQSHGWFHEGGADYARYRPSYPPELFAWIASRAPGHACAWDCATGSGQAALDLAEHFDCVFATDVSGEQLAHAPEHPRVNYRVAPAEHVPMLDDGEVDAITVAQALHWFDHEGFYAEARRVARPGAVIVAWTYPLVRIDPQVDAVMDRYYSDVVGPFWPPERRHVEAGYRSLPWPFEPIEPPRIAYEDAWSLDDLVGYLGTWSAFRRYRQERGTDPREQVIDPLRQAWGEAETRPARWELAILAGRVATG